MNAVASFHGPIKLRSISTIIFAAAALASSPAFADWQNTHWGMSDKELQRSGLALTRNTDRGKDPGEMHAAYSMRYKAGGVPFTAYLIQDAPGGRLVEVRLDADGLDDCSSARGLLASAYGVPESDSPSKIMSITTWRSPESGNRVAFIRIGGDSCTVIYQPLKTPGAAGGL